MSRRIERVNQLIKEELAKIIQLELKDPRLSMITVTRVDTSPDLKRAEVFISIYGDEQEMARSLKAINGATGFLRHELGEKVKMKYTPELVIHHDRSLVKGDSVLKIISDMEEKQAEVEEEQEGEEG